MQHIVLDFRVWRSELCCFQGVEACGMALVLDCIYTTSLELSEENVESVLLSAHHLQMHLMVQQCEQFIVDHIRQVGGVWAGGGGGRGGSDEARGVCVCVVGQGEWGKMLALCVCVCVCVCGGAG